MAFAQSQSCRRGSGPLPCITETMDDHPCASESSEPDWSSCPSLQLLSTDLSPPTCRALTPGIVEERVSLLLQLGETPALRERNQLTRPNVALERNGCARNLPGVIRRPRRSSYRNGESDMRATTNNVHSSAGSINRNSCSQLRLTHPLRNRRPFDAEPLSRRASLSSLPPISERPEQVHRRTASLPVLFIDQDVDLCLPTGDDEDTEDEFTSFGWSSTPGPTPQPTSVPSMRMARRRRHSSNQEILTGDNLIPSTMRTPGLFS